MESALCLSFCSSSAKSSCIPSTLNVRLTTKLRSSYSSYFTSKYFYKPNVFCPVICAHDRSSMLSEHDKGENKIVKGSVGASLILACAIGIMSCSSKMNLKAIVGPKEMYHKAPTTPVLAHPIAGRHALNSFLDVGIKLAF